MAKVKRTVAYGHAMKIETYSSGPVGIVATMNSHIFGMGSLVIPEKRKNMHSTRSKHPLRIY